MIKNTITSAPTFEQPASLPSDNAERIAALAELEKAKREHAEAVRAALASGHSLEEMKAADRNVTAARIRLDLVRVALANLDRGHES